MAGGFMKLLLPALIAAFPVFAHAFTCKIKVIHSMCSSGNVEITIDENNGFRYHEGDVQCWAADFDQTGTVKKAISGPLYQAQAYNLFTADGAGLPVDFGKFLYSPSEGVGRLEIFTVPGHSRFINFLCDKEN
jgi:hypothetical protein